MKKLAACLAFALFLCLPLASQALRTEFQDTPPKYVLEKDGSFSGLCLEILALMEKARPGLSFSYPSGYVAISRISRDLQEGKIDAYFGLAKTPEREATFDFLAPLFVTRYMIAARRGGPWEGISSLEELRKPGAPFVYLLRGTASANYFEHVGGLSLREDDIGLPAALERLADGSVPLLGYYDLSLYWASRATALRIVPLPMDFGTDAQWLCVPKAMPAAARAALSSALEAAKRDPAWAEMIGRYFRKP